MKRLLPVALAVCGYLAPSVPSVPARGTPRAVPTVPEALFGSAVVLPRAVTATAHHHILTACTDGWMTMVPRCLMLCVELQDQLQGAQRGKDASVQAPSAQRRCIVGSTELQSQPGARVPKTLEATLSWLVISQVPEGCVRLGCAHFFV